MTKQQLIKKYSEMKLSPEFQNMLLSDLQALGENTSNQVCTGLKPLASGYKCKTKHSNDVKRLIMKPNGREINWKSANNPVLVQIDGDGEWVEATFNAFNNTIEY